MTSSSGSVVSSDTHKTPRRIQLRRTKGWRKPEGAIVVARPTRWGNPFTIAALGRDGSIETFRSMISRTTGPRAGWVHLDFLVYPSDAEIRGHLSGHDLACWCPLDQPCHADVLLEIANGWSS